MELLVNSKRNDPRSMDPTVITALEALQDLNVAELKKRYRELFGEESKSSNNQFLFRRIAWRMQANADGDLSERARRRATEIADDRDLRVSSAEGVSRPARSRLLERRSNAAAEGREVAGAGCATDAPRPRSANRGQGTEGRI